MPAVSPPAIASERFEAAVPLDQLGGHIHQFFPGARKRDQPPAVDIDRRAQPGGEGERVVRAEQHGFGFQQDAGGDLGRIGFADGTIGERAGGVRFGMAHPSAKTRAGVDNPKLIRTK